MISVLALLSVGWLHWIDEPAIDRRVDQNTSRIAGVEVRVQDIRIEQLETKLDQVYTALCMQPGDGDLLERVRDLQKKHEDATSDPPSRGWRYPAPDCRLLLKVK